MEELFSKIGFSPNLVATYLRRLGMRFSHSCLVIAVLWYCFAAPLCSGQDNPNQLTVPRIPGVFDPPVSGAPFSATVEIISRQRLLGGSVFTLKTVTYIARDSQGRTHTEVRRLVSGSYEEEPPVTDIHIYDPVTGLSTHLDPFALIAKQTKLRAPPTPNPKSIPNPKLDGPDAPVKQIDLGTRSLKNLTLHGTLQARSANDIDEFWYSPELSIFMSRKHQDPIWEQTVNIAEFDRQEPDSSNFAIPAGYKIVEVAETQPTQPLPDAAGIDHVSNGSNLTGQETTSNNPPGNQLTVPRIYGVFLTPISGAPSLAQ
jgi:hypothetical protein